MSLFRHANQNISGRNGLQNGFGHTAIELQSGYTVSSGGSLPGVPLGLIYARQDHEATVANVNYFMSLSGGAKPYMDIDFGALSDDARLLLFGVPMNPMHSQLSRKWYWPFDGSSSLPQPRLEN